MKEKVFYYDQIKQWYKRFSSNGTQSATYNIINSGFFCDLHQKRVKPDSSSSRECTKVDCLPGSCKHMRPAPPPASGVKYRNSGPQVQVMDAIPESHHTLLLTATRLPLTNTKMFTKSTFPLGSAKIWKDEPDGVELQLVGDARLSPNGAVAIPGSPVDILAGAGKKRGVSLRGRVIAVETELDKNGVERVVTADVRWEGEADDSSVKPHTYNVEDLRIRSHFQVTKVEPWTASQVRASTLTETDEAGILIKHTGTYADGFLNCYAPRYAMLQDRSKAQTMEQCIRKNDGFAPKNNASNVVRGLRQSRGQIHGLALDIFKKGRSGSYPQWESCPEITKLNGFMGFGDTVHMEYNPEDVYTSKIDKYGRYPDSEPSKESSGSSGGGSSRPSKLGSLHVPGMGGRGPEKRQSVSTRMFEGDADTGKTATGIFSDANEQDHFLEHTTHVSVVKVVVGGGERSRWRTTQTHDLLLSLEAAVRNIDDGCPIVLLAGSGGLVDLLCKAWRLLHDTGALSARIQRQELETMTRKVFAVYDPRRASVLLTRVFNIVSVDSKVVIFDVDQNSPDALDQCILTALVQNMRPNYNRSDLQTDLGALALTEGGADASSPAKAPQAEDLEADMMRMTWWSGKENWIRRQEHVQSYELHLNALRICLLVDRVPEAMIELDAARELWESMAAIWNDFKAPGAQAAVDVEGTDRTWKSSVNSEYFRRYHLAKIAVNADSGGFRLAPSELKGTCRCNPGSKTAADCHQVWWCCVPDVSEGGRPEPCDYQVDDGSGSRRCGMDGNLCASCKWASERIGASDELEHYEEKMMLEFWYERSTSESNQYNLLHTNKLSLTFKEHVELALEWALADDRLEQVQMLKPLIDDFPAFLYDRKSCREEEGYGTTLAELYEYEDDPKLVEYLEPLLEFKKDPPSFGGKTLHAPDDTTAGLTDTINNVQEINDVRLRRIWSLVLQLLYDDASMQAPEDTNFPFEASESDLKKIGYRSARKFAHTNYHNSCPLCEMSILDKLSPNCGAGHSEVIKKSDAYGPVNGKGHDDWNHKDAGYKAPHDACAAELEKEQNNKRGHSIDVTLDRTLQSVWELIQQKRDKSKSASKKNQADLLANQEMMIWAVLMCRYDMAVFFWQEGGYAIPNALLASRLFLGMAEHEKIAPKGRLADRVTQMLEMSEKFENLAIGCLAQCYEENADTSQDVLESKLTPYDWMGRYFPGREEKKFDNCMDLAFLAKNMDFIEHVACQAVIDRKWRGGRSHSVKHTADGTLIPPKYDAGHGARYGFGYALAFGAALGAAIGAGFFPHAAETHDSGQNLTLGDGLLFQHGIGIGAGAFGLFFGIFGALLGGKVIKSKWEWPVIMNRIRAPKIKFYMDFGQTVLMVLLQSYISLGNLDTRGKNLGQAMFFEHILAGWILILIGEEIRQTFDDGWNYVYFKRWYQDVWNKMDVVIYIVFCVTYSMRVARFEPGDALLYKGLYATNCLLSWMRVFKYFAASEGLGPKVIILGELVGSLMQYMMLLGVFIISFGIFTEAIANQAFPLGGDRAQHGTDWQITLHNVIYRPYFQMYGELMLEDISSETKCIGAPFTDCSSGFESVVLPFLTGVYMIVTSLMLMNMLIADFTITFEASFEESGKIFKMERFKLLNEYDSKPWWPVPLSVFHICGRFVMNLPELWTVVSNFSSCSCCPGKPPCDACLDCVGLSDEAKEETADKVEEERRIEDFQDRCCDHYLAQHDKDEWDSVEARVARIEGEMLDAKKELAFFKGKSYSAGVRSRDAVPEIVKMKAENRDFPMFPQCTIESTLQALNEVKFRNSRISKDASAKVWRRLHTDEKLRELMKLEANPDDAAMEQVKQYHGDVGQWCIIRGAYKNNSVYQGMASQVADTETNRMLDISIFTWTNGAKLGRRCSFYQEVAMDTELGMCNQARCGCRSVRTIDMQEGHVTTFSEDAGRYRASETVPDGGIITGPVCERENPGCRYRAFERYDQSFCTKADKDCTCGRRHEADPGSSKNKWNSNLFNADEDLDAKLLEVKEATGLNSLVGEERNPLPNPFQFYKTCKTCQFQDRDDVRKGTEELSNRKCFEALGCEHATCLGSDGNGPCDSNAKTCLSPHPHSRKFTDLDAPESPGSRGKSESEKIHIIRKITPCGEVDGEGEWMGYKKKGAQDGKTEKQCLENHGAMWDAIDPVDKHGAVVDNPGQYPDAYFLRGTLPDLGRNHFIAHIVTRWKKDSMGIMIDRGGKKLMQFVAFKRHLEDNQWSIPSLLMNRMTEERDHTEEKQKKEREEKEMRKNLEEARKQWDKCKDEIETMDLPTEAETDTAPVNSNNGASTTPRCDMIKEMLEDDERSRYYERPPTMVSGELAPWWEKLIEMYQSGYTDFKLAKVQYNEAKAAPSDDRRGIEKRFNKGFSACE